MSSDALYEAKHTSDIEIVNPRGPRFTDEQREHHRLVISQRVLQGYTPAEIGRELGVTRQQVAYDLKIVEKRWREAALRDFDEARGVELAKIDALEHEYWQAWERSKKPKTQSTQRTAPSKLGADDMRVTAGIRTEERDGDPRFLDGVFKCIERRIKLYGLDEAEKIAMVGAFDVNNENDLTRRLARYDEALGRGVVNITTAVVVGDRSGQPVDSERPPSETSHILDIGGQDHR